MQRFKDYMLGKDTLPYSLKNSQIRTLFPYKQSSSSHPSGQQFQTSEIKL